jgi:phospholipid/cholesterol/gamma-HCH transport system ATP-binding protein
MIRFRNVHKSFGTKPVLRGIDLDIQRSETVVVIGQSGSGKSVLIKHLIGLLKPDEGEILLDGVEISSLDDEELLAHRKRFGMLFQGGALFDSLTVAENVSFGLERFTGLGADEIARQSTKSLEMVGLKGIEHLRPFELSGGMKKRVALARAIAYKPEIILYDEPSTGIDPIRADAINDLINLMKQELSATSVVITHDMVSAYKVADKIAMLYEGKIVLTGTPGEIKRTDNQIVQQFIHGRAEGPILNF